MKKIITSDTVVIIIMFIIMVIGTIILVKIIEGKYHIIVNKSKPSTEKSYDISDSLDKAIYLSDKNMSTLDSVFVIAERIGIKVDNLISENAQLKAELIRKNELILWYDSVLTECLQNNQELRRIPE